METKASRTLVKSAPELWELADDGHRMGLWMGTLINAPGAVEIEVINREPKSRLAWRTANSGPSGRIALTLAEKGFGTMVTITAQHRDGLRSAAEAMENLLDDLGSPERQPFVRV